MDLILWRHADAADGAPDSERRLTGKGTKQAERMAAWLLERLPKDALVLVSPARRAQETAQALGRKFETCGDLDTSATPQAVLKAAGWPRADRVVVVVGHQPTLGEAAALLITGKAGPLSVKKGAIWWFSRHHDEAIVVRAVVSPDLL